MGTLEAPVSPAPPASLTPLHMATANTRLDTLKEGQPNGQLELLGLPQGSPRRPGKDGGGEQDRKTEQMTNLGPQAETGGGGGGREGFSGSKVRREFNCHTSHSSAVGTVTLSLCALVSPTEEEE